MCFEENTKLERATVSYIWVGFWVQGKIYRKILEWVIKGSKHPIGYLPTGLWNNSSCSSLSLDTLPLGSLNQEGLSHLLLRPSSHNPPCNHWLRSTLRPRLTCNSSGPYVMSVRQAPLPEREQMWSLMLPPTSRSCLGCCKPIPPNLVGFLGLILNLAVSSPKVSEPGMVPTPDIAGALYQLERTMYQHILAHRATANIMLEGNICFWLLPVSMFAINASDVSSLYYLQPKEICKIEMMLCYGERLRTISWKGIEISLI